MNRSVEAGGVAYATVGTLTSCPPFEMASIPWSLEATDELSKNVVMVQGEHPRESKETSEKNKENIKSNV